MNVLKKTTEKFNTVAAETREITELFEIAQLEEDLETLELLSRDFYLLEKTVAALEFQKMFNPKLII